MSTETGRAQATRLFIALSILAGLWAIVLVFVGVCAWLIITWPVLITIPLAIAIIIILERFSHND